jgi:hypothetical protein
VLCRCRIVLVVLISAISPLPELQQLLGPASRLDPIPQEAGWHWCRIRSTRTHSVFAPSASPHQSAATLSQVLSGCLEEMPPVETDSLPLVSGERSIASLDGEEGVLASRCAAPYI